MRDKAKAYEVGRFLDAWLAVRQLIQAANFNHFHQAGLSATQFMTLNVLPTDGSGVGIGEVAKRMNLKPATVAKTVDSLETREMVRRTRGEPDGRRVLVSITDSGRRLQNAAAGQFREYVSGLFGKMAAGERAALIVGLESLLRASASPGRGAARETHSSGRSRPQ